jgi:thiol-disulfide isomerase/thioredoxin
MKFKYLSLLIFSVAILFQSCDKVDPPFNKTIVDSGSDKKVLLEDYTGHECVNCPGAALTAHELETLFNHKVVIISVHAGYFARPSVTNPLFDDDFRTVAGEEWDTFFGNGAQGNPNGLVDRIQVNDSYVITPGNWSTTIAPQLEQTAVAKITIANAYNADTKLLETKIDSKFLSDLEGNFHLLVCLTQDSIIAPQKNNSPEAGDVPIDTNYVHMNMLRKAINGTWGEALNIGDAVTNGQSYTNEYTLSFVDEWVPENCHVVAFIFREDTKEVLQVEEGAVLQ